MYQHHKNKNTHTQIHEVLQFISTNKEKKIMDWWVIKWELRIAKMSIIKCEEKRKKNEWYLLQLRVELLKKEKLLPLQSQKE